MRLTRALVPTLREHPAEAEAASHRLMLRAGLVRQLAAGLYVYLPLGVRALDKINAIIREEMNGIGGQEVVLPVLHPAEIWKSSGRWDTIGQEMFRLTDRQGREMCLGMTHEEVVAWLAARTIRSYRELPQTWYQIQTKERDEARPRAGVLRTREFLMKDAYTLDADEAGLDRSYATQAEAYRRIFDRCGLRYHVVDSDPGMMGGGGSHEFMAPSAAGEDEVAICAGCGYAANVELARGVAQPAAFPAWSREDVPTPGVRTIAEVCAALDIDPRLTIKSLVFVGPDGPVLALVRGDHVLHERKLARALGADARPAHPDEVRAALGGPVGSVGPLGVSLPVLADEALRTGVYVVGANREGVHVRGVVPGRDFECRFVDLHTVVPGELCSRCGTVLAVERVIEIGNIFKLGTKYSAPLGATYLDEAGRSHPIVMGSYGIGPARIAASAIEQRADAAGIVWPWAIAPYHVHVVPLGGQNGPAAAAAETIYRDCWDVGIEALLDDRDERPGVKFKDADLLGLPARVTVGRSFERDGVVEVRARATGAELRVPPGEVVGAVREVAGGA